MRLEFEPKVAVMPLAGNGLSEEVPVSASPEFKTMLKKGIDAAKNGDRDAARTFLMEASEIEPLNEDAWMWLASISEYPEELFAFLNNVLTINPSNVRAKTWMAATETLLAKTLVQRATDAHQNGDDERAMQCVDQALSYDQRFEVAWSLKARIARSDDQKVECLQRVLALNPKNEEAQTALKALTKTGSKEASNGRRKVKDMIGASEDVNIAALETVEIPTNMLSSFGIETTAAKTDVAPQAQHSATAKTNGAPCPLCSAENDATAIACNSCHAALSLSDIEALLSNPKADRERIQQSVTQMEAEWNLREFDKKELTALGIGQLNLRNFDVALKYLNEALTHDPNNVILAGQINAIAIRLDEMRRQEEIHESRPVGKKILVVDDSPTVRKLLSSKLEKSGHNVVCAVDGVEGLAMIAEGLPDLVLLDIAMPRMDGYEVCKEIRSNPAAKDLPVVMISGKDGFFDKVRGRMAGATGYVTKPFGPDTLMKALETYLVPETVSEQ